MKAKPAALAFCFAVLLVGCEKPAPVSMKDAENTPALKQFIGRTDIVKIKHFFTPEELIAKGKGEFISPGRLELGAVIAYEPGKESDRRKGVRMEVVSFLDEDEAKDLAAALSYVKQVNGTWATAPPSDDVEVMFASKDDFVLSLLPDQKTGNTLFVESGNASISFPVMMLEELQQKLESNLRTLKNNEK